MSVSLFAMHIITGTGKIVFPMCVGLLACNICYTFKSAFGNWTRTLNEKKKNVFLLQFSRTKPKLIRIGNIDVTMRVSHNIMSKSKLHSIPFHFIFSYCSVETNSKSKSDASSAEKESFHHFSFCISSHLCSVLVFALHTIANDVK